MKLKFFALALLLASRSFAAEFADLLPTIEPTVVYVEQLDTQAGPDQRALSKGSGVVIRDDGHILTVAHLVDAPGPVRVRVADGREFAARILGLDKRTNIAVLRVEASNLPVARIGQRETLRKADRVWALGRLSWAMRDAGTVVTDGIVSALNTGGALRSLMFIQSSAPFLPPMGGGGLFNSKGELVGINSEVYKQSEGVGNAVLSFSIPIHEAMKVASQLIEFGVVRRGALGLQIDTVTSEMASALGLARKGALVRSTRPGGGGERAGIQPGDIILGLNGNEIVEATDFPWYIGQTKPGEKVELRVFRRGGEIRLQAVTDQAP